MNFGMQVLDRGEAYKLDVRCRPCVSVMPTVGVT